MTLNLLKPLLLSASFCLPAAALNAQTPFPTGFIQPQGQPQYTGIPTQEIEGSVSSQKTPVWCWAACIQMVLNYHGIEISQEAVAKRAFGPEWEGEAPAIGASAEMITENLNNWNVDSQGKGYRVSSQVFQGSPDAATIIRHLAQKKPIIVGYGPNAQNGHVVLVTAVSYFTNAMGQPQITSVVVRDPFPDFWNIQTRGRREYPNGALPAPVQWTWLVDVTREER